MRIKMIKSTPGSIDGSRVQHYEADQEYDLSATPGAIDLARAFVEAGLAEEVGAVAELPAAPDVGGEETPEPNSGTVDAPAPVKPGRKPKAA